MREKLRLIDYRIKIINIKLLYHSKAVKVDGNFNYHNEQRVICEIKINALKLLKSKIKV
jgi:hypothetical protein